MPNWEEIPGKPEPAFCPGTALEMVPWEKNVWNNLLSQLRLQPNFG